MTELERLRARVAMLEIQVADLKAALKDAMFFEAHGGLVADDIVRFRALIDKDIL